MKKLLIALLTTGSIVTYANDCTVRLDTRGFGIEEESIKKAITKKGYSELVDSTQNADLVVSASVGNTDNSDKGKTLFQDAKLVLSIGARFVDSTTYNSGYSKTFYCFDKRRKNKYGQLLLSFERCTRGFNNKLANFLPEASKVCN